MKFLLFYSLTHLKACYFTVTKMLPFYIVAINFIFSDFIMNFSKIKKIDTTHINGH